MWLIIQNGKIIKGTHLTGQNFKMMFSFAIISNIAVTTLKFVNKVGAKI